jgi:predicted  nucleic acid-binding Zn-ribbon protein
MTVLETIVELQGALGELRQVETRLQGIPDWMRELHDEHGRRRAELDALAAEIDGAVRERRAAEAAIADAQERLKKYQQQIGLVSTQREYGALLKEIDTVKVQIGKLEEEALQALDRLEQARAGSETQRQEFAELDTRYGTELERWESEKPAVAQRASELRDRVATLRERLPRAVAAQFDRVLARHGGEAVAAVRRGERGVYSCSACNYRVRPQVVVEIRNTGNLVQCDACKRILMVPDGT